MSIETGGRPGKLQSYCRKDYLTNIDGLDGQDWTGIALDGVSPILIQPDSAGFR